LRGSFRIGRIAGIDVGIHYSWIFAFVLFSWIFARGTFPANYPGWDLGTYWAAGIIVSLFVFISVLIHEMCHSIVARSMGMKVESIILFIFGGVSNIEKEPETARTEFLMAGAGPLSSLLLAGIFSGTAFLLSQNSQAAEPIVAVIAYIGLVNLILAVFNIIPGFPLDGGRVLRSIIWGVTNNLKKSTLIAGNVGRAFGWAMILFGIANFFGFSVGGLQGTFINGIWFIFIGWFLTSAADSAIKEQTLQQELSCVRVKDVMDHNPECVNPAASIEQIVHESFIQRGRRALPVCSEGKLLGIVTLADVKRIPQDEWLNTPVQEVMTRVPVMSVSQDSDLNDALKLLAQNEVNQIPVMDDGQIVGLLSRADVLRYLQTRQELGIKNSRKSNF
jgi:Zn-dependent protease/CBS domain-containing protein